MRQQPQTNDCFDDRAELHADLLLLVRGEHVDDAVDGLSRVRRVQGRKHEVPGFGDRQGGGDGVHVAHFADQHHVRVFAQRRAQRVGEAVRVVPDLALIDDRHLMKMQILDRIFHREDVPRHRRVDDVDHRCERGRLTGAGRTGDEHQTVRAHRKVRHHRRQVQAPERRHGRRNGAEHGADDATLAERVDTEAAEAFQAVREVKLEVLLKLFFLDVRQNAVDQALRIIRRQLGELGRRQAAVDAQHRRQTHAHVQVGCAAFNRHAHQLVHAQTKKIAYVCCHSLARFIIRDTKTGSHGKPRPLDSSQRTHLYLSASGPRSIVASVTQSRRGFESGALASSLSALEWTLRRAAVVCYMTPVTFPRYVPASNLSSFLLALKLAASGCAGGPECATRGGPSGCKSSAGSTGRGRQCSQCSGTPRGMPASCNPRASRGWIASTSVRLSEVSTNGRSSSAQKMMPQAEAMTAAATAPHAVLRSSIPMTGSWMRYMLYDARPIAISGFTLRTRFSQGTQPAAITKKNAVACQPHCVWPKNSHG